MKTVKPLSLSGFNMSVTQLFGFGPKFTITCGGCMITFQKRVPMIDEPGVKCPNCGSVNILPLEVN